MVVAQGLLLISLEINELKRSRVCCKNMQIVIHVVRSYVEEVMLQWCHLAPVVYALSE